jgi:hypothetical protein
VEYTDSDFKKLGKRFKVPLFGTDEWYIQEIVDTYMDGKPFGYKHTIDDFGPYSLRVFYCSAEADYDFLGQHNDTIDTEHYSDYLGGELPPKVDYIPHWYRLDRKIIDPLSFKLYNWLRNCKHQHYPISRNSELWLQTLETQELEIAGYTVLKPFRKPKESPTYPTAVQAHLDYLQEQQKEHQILPDIVSIPLVRHNVEGLNKYILDKRPIPFYQVEGLVQFPLAYLQWYLRQRIIEWVAHGGEILFDKGYSLAIAFNHSKFQRPFYWDLWKDIKNLRREYTDLLVLTLRLQELFREHKGYQFEDKARAYSFDTQT